MMNGSQAEVSWTASLQLHPLLDKTWIRAAFNLQNCRIEASYIDCMDWNTHWNTHMDIVSMVHIGSRHSLEAFLPYMYVDMAM